MASLYLSGQIAMDERGNLHTADIATETRKVMDNVGNLLKSGRTGSRATW